MKTKRAFMLDAIYRYICEKGLTPYIVVDVKQSNVVVPMEYSRNGFITLNLRPAAVGNFELTDDGLRFSARFNGVSRFIVVPLPAICSIYPKEDIRDVAYFVDIEGTHFSGAFVDEEKLSVNEPETKPVEKTRPKLTIVKGGETS